MHDGFLPLHSKCSMPDLRLYRIRLERSSASPFRLVGRDGPVAPTKADVSGETSLTGSPEGHALSRPGKGTTPKAFASRQAGRPPGFGALGVFYLLGDEKLAACRALTGDRKRPPQACSHRGRLWFESAFYRLPKAPSDQSRSSCPSVCKSARYDRRFCWR